MAELPNPDLKTGRPTPFSDAELAEFQQLILDKRAAAMEEVDAMRAQIAEARDAEADSAYSFHMADAGTDAREQGKSHMLDARPEG